MVRTQHRIGFADHGDGRQDIPRITLAGIIFQQAMRTGGDFSGQTSDLIPQQVQMPLVSREPGVAGERRNHQHAIKGVLLLEIVRAAVLFDPASLFGIDDQFRRRFDGFLRVNPGRDGCGSIRLPIVLQRLRRPEVKHRTEQWPLGAGDVAGGKLQATIRSLASACPPGILGRQSTVQLPGGARYCAGPYVRVVQIANDDGRGGQKDSGRQQHHQGSVHHPTNDDRLCYGQSGVPGLRLACLVLLDLHDMAKPLDEGAPTLIPLGQAGPRAPPSGWSAGSNPPTSRWQRG